MTDRTFVISVTKFTPGALIRTAKFFASPSCADRAWSTIASAPGTLSAVCAPNGTVRLNRGGDLIGVPGRQMQLAGRGVGADQLPLA